LNSVLGLHVPASCAVTLAHQIVVQQRLIERHWELDGQSDWLEIWTSLVAHMGIALQHIIAPPVPAQLPPPTDVF
jgi:hypothetical protein